MDSPIRQLVGQRLAPFARAPGIIDTSEAYIDLFADAGATGAEALASSGVGLDHFAGERVLASALLRDVPKKGIEHRLACAITDRRLAVGGYSNVQGGFNKYRWSTPHRAIQRVDVETKLLKTQVTVHADGGQRVMPVGELVPKIGPAIQAIATQVPPEQRLEPPTVFVEPAEDDPSGARAAIAGLWADDPRAVALLEQIDASVRDTTMDQNAAIDLSRRVMLAHRSRCGGPGMAEGTWTCPMSAQDLGHTLIRVFGAPTGHEKPQPDIDGLAFAIDPKRDVLGAALTGLGMASYLALGVGFSPGKAIARALIKRADVRQIEVYFTDRASHSRYRLNGRGGPLEHADAMLAHRFHQAVIALSYRVLERRIQRGWSVGYDQLMA